MAGLFIPKFEPGAPIGEPVFPRGSCPETGPSRFLNGCPSEGFLRLEALLNPNRPLSSVNLMKSLNRILLSIASYL